MDTAGMVGLMGLTFFCNKCVEVFYHFSQDGNSNDEFKETCRQAIASFKSILEPSFSVSKSDRIGLFNTNEEIESFEKVLSSDSDTSSLRKLIEELETLADEQFDLAQRKIIAGKLQRFFDLLGDYSFYATRDCLNNTGSLVGI